MSSVLDTTFSTNNLFPNDTAVSPFSSLSILTGGTKEEENSAKSAQKLAKITAKLNQGKTLTPDELTFLRKNNSILYQKAVTLMQKKKNLEEKLQKCQSKEEADLVVQQEMNALNEKDPDFEMKFNAIQEVAKEFRKSSEYQKLPQTKEDAEEQNKNNSGQKVSYSMESGSYQESFLDSEYAFDNVSFQA